ncbi:MAG TPA: TauD/TfdA family dioxygenase [Blastocatellia bacterium]|nr:TauD/TfdA family dioxygenase [Blastocatellia bacterium]
MLPPPSEIGKIEVPSELASDLLKAAESLPLYDNKEFYSPILQLYVCDQVRRACPDGFDWLIGLVRERIAKRPYSASVLGLRFDEGNRLFVAINRAFGELVARPYEKPRAQLVHYIEPATDILSSRGGHESERLHTDTADWETPVELISMLCVRADPGGGGRSRILDIDAIRDEVKNRLGGEILELLETEPVPWQLAAYRGGGLKWRPVLTESSICWRRYTIDLALDSKQAKVSRRMLASLAAFEEVISTTAHAIEFLMREGELLFSDNTRTIHARTPITERAADRLMIRSWIRAS